MANTEYKGNLVQGKGSEKFRGVVAGKDTPKKGFGYVDSPAKAAKDGNPAKNPYRSLKFFLSTSNDNKPVIEIIGSPKEFAYAYSKKERKSMKIEWAKRNNKLPGDYELILPEYDLAEKLNKELKDGSEVVIVGEPKYSVYENPKSGVSEEQISNTIKYVYPVTEPINFNAEGFKEESTFAQDIVVRDFSEDTKIGKGYLFCYIVGYAGKFNTATFEINITTMDQSFYRNLKSLKFGDSIRVNGIVHNRQLKKEVSTGWGTSEDVNDGFKKCFEITGADGASLIKKRYKELDFVESQVDATFAGNISTNQGAKDVPLANTEETLPFQV